MSMALCMLPALVRGGLEDGSVSGKVLSRMLSWEGIVAQETAEALRGEVIDTMLGT